VLAPPLGKQRRGCARGGGQVKGQADLPYRKQRRREAARARQEARASRTDTDQLKELQARDCGNCKEAVRLTNAMAKP